MILELTTVPSSFRARTEPKGHCIAAWNSVELGARPATIVSSTSVDFGILLNQCAESSSVAQATPIPSHRRSRNCFVTKFGFVALNVWPAVAKPSRASKSRRSEKHRFHKT
jgi:hypothetical protein